ncbi:putative transcriptional regulator [Anaerosolibacter carboniphilus]|uniref:Putative transcriptional regulator n=1 Tax=Anaerosolibacter carboniphilus TaxID=1417629 RepID=A0A841KXP3_9FIRM|nr:helix-turn-helix transcriptional regulator [Anaerosolibacter carboniphilus]MBB6218221.1 putative transcriptional regulator [Anaerosolibacter carboniphilus]
MREKLKQIRLEKGLTHEEIANMANINRATYTNIELGRKNPSFIVATRIKNILGYEGDDIFLDTMCRKGTIRTS